MGWFHRGLVNLGVLEQTLSRGADPVDVACYKILGDMTRADPAKTIVHRKLARESLSSNIPQVAIAAAGALAVHGDVEDVDALLQQIQQRPTSGAIVPHAMRIAVKRLMQIESLSYKVLSSLPKSAEEKLTANWITLGSILSAVGTPQAAAALLTIAPAINRK